MKDYLNLNSALTLNLLLHTSKGIEATIRFLKETKITTKGWFAKKREEEEEEEEVEEGIDEEEDQSISQTSYQEPNPTISPISL
jgi:CO dehydrogenase/acetyl-CoA synthase beta subunit